MILTISLVPKGTKTVGQVLRLCKWKKWFETVFFSFGGKRAAGAMADPGGG